ncbi:MAG TPA: acetyl-CoA hydrolase/transferase C-terminal domain-containing protein [Stellaceae bacterium]|jgi:acetyl-CoA hydrolase|nr:acetyl-CoA hydrolase/transferase C-terminal domain-containing protein [Stellaceae bacterium]
MKTPVTVAAAALDFAKLIREGETVGWAEATAEPVLLTRMLNAQAPRCPPFRLFFALTFGTEFSPDHPNVTVTAFGGGGAGRRFFARGAANLIPANISNLCDLVASGRVPINIVLIQVIGPDSVGRYSAGIGIEHLQDAMPKARLVIAQVNPELPWTEGDTVIEPGLIDILVPAAHPVMKLPARPAGPVEQAIAGHIAALVPDRATIELGIGAIPEEAARALGGKKGLGIHSGAIGGGVMELIESGAVDNRYKEIDPGVTVALMLMGSRRLYAWADRNSKLVMRGPRYTHDALVLGNFRRFVAINGALEVDLTGQVNAETASGRHVGLVGGQMDFVRAANRAPEGRSIIALPAASRNRKRSRIVARLDDGVVTTPRAEADCVVTEFGIAELRGRTLAERARALIAVADPAFRDELLRASERLV